MTAIALLTVALIEEADIIGARQRARQIAGLLGFDAQDQTRIATAVSEIARNAITHGGGGRVQFSVETSPSTSIRILIRDSGPGIAGIERAPDERSRSMTGLGAGISGARRLMDHFDIVTAPGAGTSVALYKNFPRGAPPMTHAVVAEIGRALTAAYAADPLAEVRTQNQELLQSLAALKAKQDETERLNMELGTTHRGVVALYAELDEKAAQLAALNTGLEERISAAVAECQVANEALRQSQKMEAVGQLTGGLAHDFNNLLQVVNGSLERVQLRLAQGRSTDIACYVVTAQEAAKRAAALTHRLLAFSRRQTLTPRPVNVNRLASGMEELIRRTVGPEITLELIGAAGLWLTLADSNQLENALLNLCINARDAMPAGGRITIETANRWLDDRAARERDMAPGQYLSICVTDTGTGMTQDVVDRAFDPFFTTKPLGFGTGLGLSMTYGFARQSGGQVRIYSEVGTGTTMCIYLPRLIGEEDAFPSDTIGSALAGASQGETVLVVDDEPMVRMLVREVLEEAGFATLEAEDGRSGLRVLQSAARIDLLITDVGLPGGLNGRQMADAARVDRPDLKVLFITGYAENAVIGNGHLDFGMSILTKPFAMDGLSAKVREMMSD